LHDLDLDAEDTLAEFNVADGNIDKVLLGLTSGNLITGVVFLGLCALTSDLSRHDDFATGGASASHDSAHNVIGGHSDWSSVKQLVLEGLDVCGGGQVLVVGEGLDGELDLVVLIVEVVSLFNEGLDLLNLAGGLVEKVLAVSSADTDLSAHVGGADLNAGVALHAEGTGEELVELSLENSVSNELFLGVNLLDLLVCHLLD
jgi:hypothetical protein